MAIQSFSPTIGGAELQLERLLPLLTARGVRARVLTRAVRGSPRRAVIAGAPVLRTAVPGESPLASAVYISSAQAHIVRHRGAVDLVHAHGTLSPASIALGARALGKPAIVTPLGAGPPGDLNRLRRKPGGVRRLDLLARHARFVALSAALVDELHGYGVPPGHVALIPNGVDTAEYSPVCASERARLRGELELDEGRVYGLFVGRLHPVKQVDVLLHALARTHDLDLLIVGDGEERVRLEQLARDLSVETRVRFIGFTTRVADYLKAADVFALPSLGEGLSNALMEAMACGLACVVTESVGGVADLFGADRGITVLVGDIGAWACALQHLTDRAEDRERLGGAAAAHVRATYSLDSTADRLVALYRSLVR